jgi:hypothetical protein
VESTGESADLLKLFSGRSAMTWLRRAGHRQFTGLTVGPAWSCQRGASTAWAEASLGPADRSPGSSSSKSGIALSSFAKLIKRTSPVVSSRQGPWRSAFGLRPLLDNSAGSAGVWQDAVPAVTRWVPVRLAWGRAGGMERQESRTLCHEMSHSRPS